MIERLLADHPLAVGVGVALGIAAVVVLGYLRALAEKPNKGFAMHGGLLIESKLLRELIEATVRVAEAIEALHVTVKKDLKDEADRRDRDEFESLRDEIKSLKSTIKHERGQSK